MRIRKGFVSNSSSASFVVEVKGEKEDIINALYENIEFFQEEYYKKLLLQTIAWKEKQQTEAYKGEIESYKKDLKELEEYVVSDLSKIQEEKEKKFAEWQIKRHKEKVVRGVLSLRHYFCSSIDDGYVSFSNNATMYNDWSDIAMRKELIEMLAFFTFMRYEVRTRIESDL